ncbi:MAG: ATP-dependent Clp protease ATP-binding subunit [Armatimonadetes bacterium]|nr:ATP-dependent Clp protease ATP-binding subunit [Armatimonadota bacterium]
MPQIKQRLQRKLEGCDVRVESPDRDTVILYGVPVGGVGLFTKERTNLLISRSGRGEPFLVFVDEDLRYVGDDARVASAFSSGPQCAGWRALFVARKPTTVQAAVEEALAALGFGGEPPALPSSAEPPEVGRSDAPSSRRGVDLTELARAGSAEVTVAREEEIAGVVSSLLKWGQGRMPLIVGPSGVGKTNLLHGLSRRLLEVRPDWRVTRVELAGLFAGIMFPAEKDSLLADVLNTSAERPGTVLALEHLELAACDSPGGCLLLSEALDAGLGIVTTVIPAHLALVAGGQVGRRAQVFELSEPGSDDTFAVLSALCGRIGAHHGVEIEDSVMRLCAARSAQLPGCLPAKAIDLLDSACARAALCGASVIGPDDVYSAADRLASPFWRA